MGIYNLNWGKGITPKSDGQLDFSNMIETLDTFQSDGIDYLYDLEPQSLNLFWVGNFMQAMGPRGGQIKPFYNAAYRIRKITIPLPTLKTDENKLLRTPIFKDAEFSHEVTIDWFEDVYHSVKKYHLDWFARWYNRQFDVLRCGVDGKFRQCTVVGYHYVNDDVDSIIEVPSIQPIMAIKIGGMVPTKIPDIEFDYNKDGNDQWISIKYKVGLLQWAYSDKIGMGRNTSIWGEEPPAASVLRNEIWDPEGFAQEGGAPSETLLERVRITRSATMHQPAEGAV